MAHPAQRDFVAGLAARADLAGHFRGGRVLEIGSLIVNGTIRDLFGGSEYLGVDVAPGPGVDLVGVAHELPAVLAGGFDAVVSCEALEHDQHWRQTVAAMVAALMPGGLLIITCAGPGRVEHGTRKSSPGDSGTASLAGPWADYYRNLSVGDLASALGRGAFARFEFIPARGGLDTQFWGVRDQ